MLPGGLGATEVTMGGLLTKLVAMPLSSATALVMLGRLATLWFSVALGALVLLATQKRFNINDENAALLEHSLMDELREN